MVAPDAYYSVTDALFYLRGVVTRNELMHFIEKGSVPCIFRSGEIFLLGSSILDVYSGKVRI